MAAVGTAQTGLIFAIQKPMGDVPEGRMEPAWPEYPASIALLSDVLRVKQNYSSDSCKLWRKNGLYAYAWMN